MKFQEGNWNIREGATSLGNQACPTTKVGLQMEVSRIALRSWAPVYAHLHGFTTKHLVVALRLLLFQRVISSEGALGVKQRRAKASWIFLGFYACCNPTKSSKSHDCCFASSFGILVFWPTLTQNHTD